jgi:hypothetical protein
MGELGQFHVDQVDPSLSAARLLASRVIWQPSPDDLGAATSALTIGPAPLVIDSIQPTLQYQFFQWDTTLVTGDGVAGGIPDSFQADIAQHRGGVLRQSWHCRRFYRRPLCETKLKTNTH